MNEVPGTRPQTAYIPPAQPVFTPPVPAYTGPRRRRWSTKQRLLAGAGVAAIVLVIGIIAGGQSSQSPYVAQLQGDGYTVTQQGALSGGEGIGYAEGDNASGAGELVVQTKSDADAQAAVAAAQNDGAIAAANGDLLIIQDSSYATIQQLVADSDF